MPRSNVGTGPSARRVLRARGTLFVLELPLWTGEVSDVTTTSTETSTAAKPLASSLWLLIAEDEAIVRMMLEAEMEDAGHDVAAAVDGTAAVELFGEQAFDLAIIDMGLPGIPGNELARRLRQLIRRW